MRRLIASIALAAFGFCYFVPVSRANVCVNPKIKSAQACGYVVDRTGMPVPNADVYFYYDIDTISTKTDARGFFQRTDLPPAKIWVNVRAIGFSDASQTIDLLVKPAKNCSKPLFVMMEAGGGVCNSIIRTKKSDLPLPKKD